MQRKNLVNVTLLAAFVLGAGAIVWIANRQPAVVSTDHPQGNSLQREEGERVAKADAEVAAQRKREAAADQATKGGIPAMGEIKAPPGYGVLTPINAGPDASPQVKAAVEAALTKTHPERLSCAIMPAAFDVKKWTSNDENYRAEYLKTPEPARCYQSAQPGKGVKQIALACPAYIETLQGRPVELRVRADVGMPVTFTSFDAAKFTAGSGNTGSQLTTQTVVADENGIASATLLATPGVIDDCRVIASCPVNAGLAKITVHAKLPEEIKSPEVAASSAPVSAK